MTKSILVALVLVGLSLGIMWVWFSDRPASDPVNIGAQSEQAQSAAEDSSALSRPRDRELAAASLAINISPNSRATPATDSSAPTADTSGPTASASAASKSRLVQATRGERQGSAFSDEGQAEELAIGGLVRDEEGYPLANIEVQAEPIRPPGADKLKGDQILEATRLLTWTDFDGSFYFEKLADDEYRIRVAPMDGFVAAQTTARVGVMSANLVLARLQDVRVYGIVSSTKGKPLGDVQVIAGPPKRNTATDLQGVYELNISLKGKNRGQTIYFRRDGYRDGTVQLTPADLDGGFYDFPLDVTLESLKEITIVTGRLEGPDGRPVVGKMVSFKSSRLQTHYSAQSDARGDFYMEDVEPGKDYRVSVLPGGEYRNYERAQLEIPADGLIFDIVLEPLGQGELSGWMTDVEGNPIPGFALTLNSKVANGHSVQVVGDHQGFFAVKEFPEGSAVLKTNSYPIFKIQGIRSSYEAEEPVRVVLDMGQHTLLGRVTNGSGNPVAAPDISLVWGHNENGVQNNSTRITTADRNGRFALTGLGFGVHLLRVNAPGFNGAVITINVGMDPDSIVVELEEKT